MKRTLILGIIIIASAHIINGQSDSTTLIKVGDQSPVFRCKTTEGKSVDLAKLKGKVIMVNFFATWCPPCNLELPVLQKNIWDKYKDNPDFVLIILGREHSESEVRDYAEKKNFTMPFAPDPDREIFSLFATQNIPRNIIIGKDGIILFEGTGYSDEEFKRVEKLLGEKLK